MSSIAELRELVSNWDTYGAPPIDPRAIAVAEHLQSTPMQLVPTSEGGVSCVWFVNDVEYSVTIKPDGSQE